MTLYCFGENIKHVSVNKRLGWTFWFFEPLTTLLWNSLEKHFWQVFTCSRSGEEVENVSANKRHVHPYWISKRFKKMQHFFRTPNRIIVVSLVTVHAVVLKKTLKIWKVSDIRTDGQTDAVHFSIRKAQLSLCLGWAKKKGRYRSGKINFFFFFQCLPCLYTGQESDLNNASLTWVTPYMYIKVYIYTDMPMEWIHIQLWKSSRDFYPTLDKIGYSIIF